MPPAPSRRVTDTTRFKLYEWGEWASRLILVGVAAINWQMYNDVQAFKAKRSDDERRLSAVETRVEQALTRAEAMEMMKRLELLMLNMTKEAEIRRLQETRRGGR